MHVGDSTEWKYSEWGMRGLSVLGRVLLMGSSVFGWSLLMARRLDVKPVHNFL